MAAFNFPIVGIGASAGGLDAFRGFFEHMPADSGMAFIVILPAERKNMLPEILARWTPMRVFEAADEMPVEANCVNVPPPHADVTLTMDVLAQAMTARSGSRRSREAAG